MVPFRWSIRFVVVAFSLPTALPAAAQPTPPEPQGGIPIPNPPAPFQFTFAPKTSAKDLLPPAPQSALIFGSVPTEFQTRPEGPRAEQKPIEETTQQLAKFNQPNVAETDARMMAPINQRADLRGRPSLIGDDRTTGDRVQFFTKPVITVRQALPPTPKRVPIPGPVLTDDLTKVPEVEFQARPENPTADLKQIEKTARQFAWINHFNAIETDGFMAGLLKHRSDPAGLPVLMGDDCRTTGDRVKFFTEAVVTVNRERIGTDRKQPIDSNTGELGRKSGPMKANPAGSDAPESFWSRYAALCQQEDAVHPRSEGACAEQIARARIAALAQMLAADPAEIRLGLVKYLTAVPHVEATQALARMAVFSSEDDVRSAALAALKSRRAKEYTEILVAALRYPWPAVARRAADAIAKLGRTDLIPDLLDVFGSSDPRLPTTKETRGMKAVVIREVVKVNHHRNCLLCHAPNGSGAPNPDGLLAGIAIEGRPLATPAQGYLESNANIMIRVDVTYLRPDFSATLSVADAHPWPEAQRFDFLVRERQLTTDEAATYREKLAPKEKGALSPYQEAALTALREMTGKDTAPTVDAWRKLLALPTPH